MVEITVAFVIRQIITAVLISVGIAVVYTGLILAISAFLRENSKNYPEVK